MNKIEREEQWHQLFMRFAGDVGNMSRARRLKVGAVAVKDRRVVAIGYNGTPPGADNNCEDELPDGSLVSKENVIHAEDNLIRFAEANDISLYDCTLYITHSPCPHCCEKISKAGFSKVVFGKQFRDMSGLQALENDKGVEVYEWN